MPKRPTTSTRKLIQLAHNSLVYAKIVLEEADKALETADARTGKPDPSKRRKAPRAKR